MAKTKITPANVRKRASQVLNRLRKAYPDARCTLDHTSPLELLVATILAAQCTDERVNLVTKDLFRLYSSARDYVDAPQEELEKAVRQCGFYRNKAKSIKRTCEALLERFKGEVPGTMEELVELEGVGRKTANVILGECFETPAIVVDTHCSRLAKRLGFTKNDDPNKIEQDLMKLWPRKDWSIYSHTLVFHGRNVCHARAPKCSQCVVRDLCQFPESKEGKRIAR